MGGRCVTFWVKGLELVFADVNKQMGIIKNHCPSSDLEAGSYCTLEHYYSESCNLIGQLEVN